MTLLYKPKCVSPIYNLSNRSDLNKAHKYEHDRFPKSPLHRREAHNQF